MYELGRPRGITGESRTASEWKRNGPASGGNWNNRTMCGKLNKH